MGLRLRGFYFHGNEENRCQENIEASVAAYDMLTD